MRFRIILLAVFGLVFEGFSEYQPTWSSIDSRPLPKWYDDSKLGIFCHWGVYSVPAHRSEWIWWYWKGSNDTEVTQYLDKHFPGQTYADFASQFTAEDFDPDSFASIIKSSGARYFVITSKHHEGFTMWPSKTAFNWNSVDIGPKRDIVGDLKKSITKKGIHFGLYFSQYEWFHPLYLDDVKNNRTNYVEQVSYPQMKEIVTNYEPEVIWSDGDWDRTDEYWKSKEFLAWLYNESPVKDNVVVNDRWGHEIMGKHGGFLTYSDHYDPGHLLERKWENCMTLDTKSWGNRRDMTSADVHTVKQLIEQLIRTISCGGNLLLNVGPDKYGRIVPIFEERLKQLGEFVSVHEEAIFGTKPWIHQNDTDSVWYTSSVKNSDNLSPQRIFNPQDPANTIIYAWILDYPKDDLLHLSSVKMTPHTRVQILGTDIKLARKEAEKGIIVNLKPVHWTDYPSKDVIVLKIEYAGPSRFDPIKNLKRHYQHHLRHQKMRRLMDQILRQN